MLLVVGIQVVQRESVMAGEEVHAGIVARVIVVVVGIEAAVEVAGAGDAPGGLPGVPVISLQISPQGIPVASVPLRPALAGGELPHLVEPACVPGLRDQLHVPQDRVGGQKLQQRRVVQGRAVLMPPQDAGQVEAEAVDAVAHRPVAQAFQDQLADDGVVAVQGIAAAAEIIVIAARREHIVHLVVEALEAEGGPLLVALGSVIEHHVQDHFYAVVVEGLDQHLQLIVLVGFLIGDIVGVGGKEAHRIIAPVVQELLAVHLPGVDGLVEFEDGHQLHRVDPQLLQIGNLLHQAREGARIGDAGGGMVGEAAHMELIDDQVAHGAGGLRRIAPVEAVLDDTGVVTAALAVAPDPLAGDEAGVRIQEHGMGIEQKPVLRLIGPVYLVGILEILNVQPEDDHGIHIPYLIGLRKGQPRIRGGSVPVEEEQGTGGPVMGVDGEVHAHGERHGPVHVKEAGTDGKALDFVHGRQGRIQGRVIFMGK